MRTTVRAASRRVLPGGPDPLAGRHPPSALSSRASSAIFRPARHGEEPGHGAERSTASPARRVPLSVQYSSGIQVMSVIGGRM